MLLNGWKLEILLAQDIQSSRPHVLAYSALGENHASSIESTFKEKDKWSNNIRVSNPHGSVYCSLHRVLLDLPWHVVRLWKWSRRLHSVLDLCKWLRNLNYQSHLHFCFLLDFWSYHYRRVWWLLRCNLRRIHFLYRAWISGSHIFLFLNGIR